MIDPTPTREARRYATRELLRRADPSLGAAAESMIECGESETVVRPSPGNPARIIFPHAPASHWAGLAPGRMPTTRAAWLRPPSPPAGRLVPDLIVPFAHRALEPGAPLFRLEDSRTARCELDLPGSTLLVLSRLEEEIGGRTDVHGRFPSEESVAVRHDFFHRPIVDEWGLALAQAIEHLLPGRPAPERPFRSKLSHDIDRIGIPFRAQATIGHTILRRRPQDTVRDLLGWTGMRTTWLKCVEEIVDLVSRHGLSSAVYWKAVRPTAWDTGYDPRSRRVRPVVERLRDRGVEMGVHPGYFTFGDPAGLEAEVGIVRALIGTERLGGRQHFLRWSPATWRHWEACRMAYDSSVAYTDRSGFRAGTCVPFRPWLRGENRAANLVEIPLVVMDGALLEGARGDRNAMREAMRDRIARCKLVGGVFTLLWHNCNLRNPAYDDILEATLKDLESSRSVGIPDPRTDC